MLERELRRLRPPNGEGRPSRAGACLRALEHDPMRRHSAFGAAGHHDANLLGAFRRQMIAEQQAEGQAGIPAAEIIDQPIAFGLSQHRHHTVRIDPARVDRGFEA